MPALGLAKRTGSSCAFAQAANSVRFRAGTDGCTHQTAGVLTANDNFLACLGYSLDEIKGKHHRMFADPAFANSLEYQALWTKLNRGEFDTGVYKRIAKGGREIWIQASYNPIFGLDGKPFLIVPYTLETNDMRFATPQGFNSGDQFFTYLKDAFDTLYAEGKEGSPKMMSVGLHCRLVGRPGRAAALARFLDYVQSHDAVWCPRRIDIARHWIATHPCKD